MNTPVDGASGGTAIPGELTAGELELIGRHTVQKLLTPGAGEGPSQADEELYGRALAEILTQVLRQVSRVSELSQLDLLAAAFGGPGAASLSRQELLDLVSARISMVLSGRA